MTETRDRRSEPDDASTQTPWEDRQMFGGSRGIPWWAAILLAFGLAVIGASVDFTLSNTLGRVFQGAYFVGCVGAICLVRRRSLFGPMVQPPLILGITVPLVVLLGGPALTGGMKTKLLAVSAPLINGFPTMAITTVITVGVGVTRIYLQRRQGAEKQDKTRSRKPVPQEAKRPATGRQPPRRREDRSATERGAVGAGRSAASAAGTGGRGAQARGQEPSGRAARDGASSQQRKQDPRRSQARGPRGDSGERTRQSRSSRTDPSDRRREPRRRPRED